jgi:(2Fe-2S) ferredoxin
MKTIIVCVNYRSNPNHPSCGAKGGIAIANHIEQQISKNQLPLGLERFHCLGHCEQGPTLKITPEGRFICGVTLEKIPVLISALADDHTE